MTASSGNHTSKAPELPSGPANPASGTPRLSLALRAIISAPTGTTEAWAQHTLDHLVPIAFPDGPATLRFVLEAVSVATGRCLALATFGEAAPVDPEGLRIHSESILIEATSSTGVCTLRLIGVQPPPEWRLEPSAQSDLRVLMMAAADLFDRLMIAPLRHREELLARLTDAQQRVFPLLVEELSEREIGDRLDRSPHTIHDHVKAIYTTLGVNSRTELLTLWLTGSPVLDGASAGTGEEIGRRGAASRAEPPAAD